MTLSTPSQVAPNVTGEGREADVAGMFDRIAASYDRLNDCISMGMHRWWKRCAVAALALKSGDAVLDIATGTGDLAERLAPVVGNTGHVTGIDISAEMLAVARHRLARFPHVALQQASAMALPLADNSQSAAIISFGLRNVDNTQQVLAEMARVVKPGGRVVNLDTAPDPWLPGFWWYFSKIMPTVGRWLSGDTAAYTYLCQSTRAFATPAQLKQQFEAVGLREVTIQRLAFGSVALITGIKA